MAVVLSYLQWMRKTTQIKLIHFLGGYTKDEYIIYSSNVHNKAYKNGAKDGIEFGIKYLANQLEHIAIQNYGCSKQDWIDKIYSKIQEALKESVK